MAANWYYAKDRQPAGPLHARQVLHLHAYGMIGPDTLVWQRGMACWETFSARRGELEEEARTHPVEACEHCGHLHEKADFIPAGDYRICPTCKDAFVRMIKQGLLAGGKPRRLFLTEWKD